MRSAIARTVGEGPDRWRSADSANVCHERDDYMTRAPNQLKKSYALLWLSPIGDERVRSSKLIVQ